MRFKSRTFACPNVMSYDVFHLRKKLTLVVWIHIYYFICIFNNIKWLKRNVFHLCLKDNDLQVLDKVAYIYKCTHINCCLLCRVCMVCVRNESLKWWLWKIHEFPSWTYIFKQKWYAHLRSSIISFIMLRKCFKQISYSLLLSITLINKNHIFASLLLLLF